MKTDSYQWTITITPPATKAIALIAMTPHERQRGRITTWVSPGAFSSHFPDVMPERLDEELAGIRGSLLDGSQIRALAVRLEGLLGARPSGTVVPADVGR